MTHPPVVCRAVVELGDDLFAAVLEPGSEQLEALGDERERGPVVVGDVDLETGSDRSVFDRLHITPFLPLFSRKKLISGEEISQFFPEMSL